MRRFSILFVAILFARDFSTKFASLNAAEKAIVTEKRIILKWPNGQTMQEQSYRIVSKGKSVQHGPATEYFENGKKRLEIDYANGKRNGLLTEYDATGTVIRRGE